MPVSHLVAFSLRYMIRRLGYINEDFFRSGWSLSGTSMPKINSLSHNVDRLKSLFVVREAIRRPERPSIISDRVEMRRNNGSRVCDRRVHPIAAAFAEEMRKRANLLGTIAELNIKFRRVNFSISFAESHHKAGTIRVELDHKIRQSVIDLRRLLYSRRLCPRRLCRAADI